MKNLVTQSMITITKKQTTAATDIPKNHAYHLWRHGCCIDELTPEVLNAFVDKIVVHEREKKNGKQTQQIDIYYPYVGIVDTPTDEEMQEMEPEYMRRTKRQTA